MSAAPASDAGAPVLDSDNPWPGLASYDEAAREFFSGRGAEAAELARRIADEPVTVLFGKSGLGKSSLLRAGVFPLLRERGVLPVLVRLRYDIDAAEPMEQIAAALFAAFAAGQIKHPPRRAGESLWEYLHREGLAFWAPKIRPARPVLVLDQFEEVFTLGRSSWTRVEAFREQLADLAENRIPAALAQRFEASGEASSGLDVHAQPYKIALSLREDFLPDLEGWHAAMPSLRRNRMRLLPMGVPQALQAVWNERTRHLVDEPLAHLIVGFLASRAGAGDSQAELVEAGHEATVEPALLSLVCRGINEARKRAGKEQFDATLFAAGKSRIVADFYRECLADRRPQVRRFIEDELVTEQGFRNSFAVVAAVGSGVVTDAELATLVDRRLLRFEQHLGTERVELAHDLLTRAVLEERVQRIATERAAAQRNRVWKRAGAVAAVMVLVVVGAIARQQYRQNADAEARARSRELAARARAVMPTERDDAVLLAVEALRAADTSETRSALLDAALYLWPTSEISANDVGGDPTYVAIAADGSQVGIVADDGTVSVWDVSTREPAQVRMWKPPGLDVAVVEFEPGGKRLLVARRGQIDPYDTSTGELQTPIPMPEPDGTASQIAVSADGHWLAARTHSGGILVRKLDDSAAEWETAQASGAEAFSLARDGRRIAWVTGWPLGASIIERGPDGKWVLRTVEVTSCVQTQSVSTAADYVVATWRGQSCMWSLEEGDRLRTEESVPIKDNVASANGEAFVAILGDDEMRVGRGNPSAAKGASLIKDADVDLKFNKIGLLAVDDAGTRVAMITGDAVRIVSTGGPRKVLLSPFEPGQLAPLADGRRIAYALPTPAGAELQVTAVDQVLRGAELPRPESHFLLAAMPTRLRGGKDRLIVTGDDHQTTVYDLSGNPVAGPIAWAEFFGKRDELILIRPQTKSMEEAIVVRADNGEQVESWGKRAGRQVLVSESMTAMLVAEISDAGTGTFVVEAFLAQGNSLLRAGRLVDMPAQSIFGLGISDDARFLTVARETGSPVLWPLDASGETSVGHPATPSELSSIELGHSNTGRFSVRGTRVGGSGTDSSLYDVALYDRDGTTIVYRLGARSLPHYFFRHSFSDDDRWLAFTEGNDLHVLDISARQLVLRWQDIDATPLKFDSTGTLLRVQLPDGEMLVPVAPDVLERFAKWLVPRDLTTDERCKYGLDQCAVRASR